MMDRSSQLEGIKEDLLSVCSEDGGSADPSELMRLLAKRMAALDELAKEAVRHPSPEVANDLKREAHLAQSLIEQLHSARTDLADDLARLEQLRMSKGGGVDAVG